MNRHASFMAEADYCVTDEFLVARIEIIACKGGKSDIHKVHRLQGNASQVHSGATLPAASITFACESHVPFTND